jgi:histidyl-tRNA synthetase
LTISDLSEDSQKRLELNPLRILDSKDPKDRAIAEKAPSVLDHLNAECRTHFERVQMLLKSLDIPFEINCRLVRGLDYYNKTVFEVVAGELGAQNSIGGGGRYDGLIKMLGGPDLSAIGFGTGIERIIQTMINQKIALPEPARVTLFLAPLGAKAQESCFKIVHTLRQHGISAQMDFTNRKLNKVMQYADQIKAKYVTVIGENELKNGIIELKEMATGNKYSMHLENLVKTLELERKTKEYVPLMMEFSQPFNNPNEAEFFKQKLMGDLEKLWSQAHVVQEKLDEMKKLFEG